MARSKQVVASVTEALNQAKHYPTAAGFMIAPLVQRGGARAWHVVDWESEKWARDGEEQELVGIDTEPETLPSLPPSKIGVWAFCFVTTRGEQLKPEILITEHGVKAAPDAETEAQGQTQEAPRLAISPKNEAIAVLTDSLRQANEDARLERRQFMEDIRATIAQSLQALTTARTEIEAASSSRRADLDLLAKAKQQEIENLRAQLTTLRHDMDSVLAHNRELSESNLQHRYASRFWDSMDTLFHNNPDKLVEGIEKLISGVGKIAQQLSDKTD